ncbi:MAG: amidohydrolase family protein [Candidatus Cryptobacteroides sp.]
MSRTLLVNAVLATSAREGAGALAIDGERIAGIWFREETDTDDSKALLDFPDADVIDLGGKVLMAGGIDAHVHFRDPGLTHKGDIGSESAAAVLGGITSFIDMPNTIPPTVTAAALEDKLRVASEYSMANYGFNLGATNANWDEIIRCLEGDLRHSIGGIKVFMGSSTGNMLVDRQESLEKLFSISTRPVLVHSEDESIIKSNLAAAREKYGEDVPFAEHSLIRSRKACIMSTIRALEMALRQGTALHLLHVSTKEEVEMVRAAKIHNPRITAETSANYLWFCDSDYPGLGSRLKCNPAIKTSDDRAALRKGLEEGLIDTIGSDHAPHLLDEKMKPYLSCPSGVPSVQQSLPVAFTLGIPLRRIASAYSEKVAEIFGIADRGVLKKGAYADLVVVDPEEEFTVKEVAYKCGWSPYEGVTLKGAVKMVWVGGVLTAKDGAIISEPSAKPLFFN